jgi:hypothetical protein
MEGARWMIVLGRRNRGRRPLIAADLVNCGLFEAEAVQMTYKQTGDCYSVTGKEAVP